MPVNLASSEISTLQLGSAEVSKGMLGTAEVYSAAPTVDPDAQAIIDAMSAPPANYQTAINNCVIALKAGNAWNNLWRFYCFAANSTFNALLDWKSPTVTAAKASWAGGPPIFSAGVGFTANGSSKAAISTSDLSTSPMAGGGNYGLGVWVNDLPLSEEVMGLSGSPPSTGDFTIHAGATGALSWARLGTQDTTNSGLTNGAKYFSGEINVARSYMYTNTALTNFKDHTQLPLPAGYWGIGCVGPAPFAYSSAQISFAWVGYRMASSRQTAIYNAMAAYLAAV